MTRVFAVGDRVKVVANLQIEPYTDYIGQVGTVTEVGRWEHLPIEVDLDDFEDADDARFSFDPDELRLLPAPASAQAEQPAGGGR